MSEFYAKLGWRLDADYDNGKDFRIIQFTPPGPGCSVIFGKNVTPAAPGSGQGLYLIVSEIQAARRELLDRGVQISEVFHNEGVYAGTDEPFLFARVRASGLDPEHRSYRRFAPAATTPSPQQRIWRAQCGALRTPTASMRSALVRPIPTGPTGTPRTWWRSRPGPRCRSEQLRHEPRTGTRRADHRRDRRQLGHRARLCVHPFDPLSAPCGSHE